MVPNGWEIKSLSDITIWSSGGTPSKRKPEYWNGDIPWISASSMRGHYYSDSDLKITKLAVEEKAKVAEKNSLLLLVRGSMLWNKIPVGITTRQVAFNQDVKCLVPKKDKLDINFLIFWFLAKENFLLNLVTGTGIGAGKLDTNDLQSLQVYLPPLPEQQKIAKILSTWDKAISTTERLIDNSKQQKKALMQQLLTGKKRLLDENGKRFEGEWDKVNLSKVVKFTGGNAFKSAEFIKAGVPLVKISNIKPDYSVNVDASVFVEYSQKHTRFEIKRGDILIAMSGATTGKVGKYEFDELAYLNQRVGRFDVKKSIIKDYLFQLLKLPKIQHNILIDAVGGAQPNISNKDIERIKVSLPSIEEQQKIAAILTNADKEIELLEQQLADLQQEKKALMQVLLTGKRRVRVDEIV